MVLTPHEAWSSSVSPSLSSIYTSCMLDDEDDEDASDLLSPNLLPKL